MTKYAVLLHGFGGSTYDMVTMKKKLQAEGFEVVNISYSLIGYGGRDIESIARKLQEKIVKKIGADAEEINFVGFSLGSVLALSILDQHKEFYEGKVKQVVQICPPNKGSFRADFMPTWLIRRPFPAIHQLRTNQDGISRITEKVVPYYNLAIIAGTGSENFLEKRLLKVGDHDGIVELSHTELNGKTPNVVISGLTHNKAPINDTVVALTSHFVKHGEFQSAAELIDDISKLRNMPRAIIEQVHRMPIRLVQNETQMVVT